VSSVIPNEFQRFPKQWVVVPFTEAVADVTSGNTKIQQRDYLDSGALAVVDQGKRLIAGLHK
jgi:type I restriction enzyme, S subunit